MTLNEKDLPILKQAIREVLVEHEAEKARKAAEAADKAAVEFYTKQTKELRAVRNAVVYGVGGGLVAIGIGTAVGGENAAGAGAMLGFIGGFATGGYAGERINRAVVRTVAGLSHRVRPTN